LISSFQRRLKRLSTAKLVNPVTSWLEGSGAAEYPKALDSSLTSFTVEKRLAGTTSPMT
jgi:hypothetical protein